MSNYFWIIYWPYNWVRQTTLLDSNGLFRVDYTVYQHDRGSAPAKPNLSVLFFRPPGDDRDSGGPSNTTTVIDLDEQLEWQRRKIRGVPSFTRRSEKALWAIEEALNGAQFFTANASRYQFIGTNSSFTFVSRLPEPFPGVTRSGGVIPRRVRVFLEQATPNRNSLILEHTPLLLEGYTEPYRIILARHAGMFWPWYYYDGAKGMWTNSWTATETMPAQVRLSLAISSWDELIGQPYLSEFPDRIYSLPSTVVRPDFQVPSPTDASPRSPPNQPHSFGANDVLDARASSVTMPQKQARLWPLRTEKHAVELEWLGRSGVELARYLLSQQEPAGQQYDALNQKWAGGIGDSNSPLAHIPMQGFPLSGGTISLRIVDLERKFNLNLLVPEILNQALVLIGVEPLEAQPIVDAIQDWQDADDTPRANGAESDYYLTLDPPHAAKNGPFDDVAELLMVKGVTPQMFFGSTNAGASAVGLRDLFTSVSGRFININTASAEVMQLIPDVDGDLARAIVMTRAGQDGIEGNEDDQPFRSMGELANVPGMTPQLAQMFASYFSTRSSTFEVTVDVKLGRQTRQYSAWLRRNGPVLQTLKFERTQ